MTDAGINHPATDDFMALLEEEMSSVIVPADEALTVKPVTAHSECSHEATKSARAKCRRERAKNDAQA